MVQHSNPRGENLWYRRLGDREQRSAICFCSKPKWRRTSTITNSSNRVNCAPLPARFSFVTVFLKKYRRTFYILNSDNSNSALTQNVLCFSSEIELPRFYCNKRREIRTLWISISNYCFLLFMLSQGVLRISGDQDYRINFLGRNIWQVFFSVAWFN